MNQAYQEYLPPWYCICWACKVPIWNEKESGNIQYNGVKTIKKHHIYRQECVMKAIRAFNLEIQNRSQRVRR